MKSPLYKNNKLQLENVQHRARHLVPSLKGLNYSKRLKCLGLPTSECRHESADVVEVYKILNNTDLVNKDKLFEMSYRQLEQPTSISNICTISEF